MTIEELNAQLAKVGDIVSRKLLELGGLENGYETGVSGYVKRTWNKGVDSQIDLVWNYDQRRRLTMEEATAIEKQLADQIAAAVDEEFWQLFERIILSNEYVEDGCYRTYISAQSHSMRLSFGGIRETLEEEGVLAVPDYGDNGFAPASGG